MADPPTATEERVVDGMLPLIRERLRVLSDVSGAVRFLFEDVTPPDVEAVVPKKLDAAKTLDVLEAGRDIVARFGSIDDESAEAMFRSRSEELEVKLGAMLMPVRVAVTGTTASPPLFGSIRLLGLDESLKRIDRVIGLLKEYTRG